MIASWTYEDWCQLTEGTCDWGESEHGQFAMGGEMQADTCDELELLQATEIEELEDRLSGLNEIDRAVLAGNALASCSDAHALLTVLEWLCKVGPDARATVAREASALVANAAKRQVVQAAGAE